jgi:aryl-alcohol dehydrogenase-like predicted oxidoreductase
MDAFEHKLDAGHALLESAVARGINYWDTGRSYGPSEGMIAPVLGPNRSRVFLASKSDSRITALSGCASAALGIMQANKLDKGIALDSPASGLHR